ncbi:MAG: DNA polymerase III subunit delta [Parahaliea sp.]
MRLYPEKLTAHLEQQCLPVYFISGDEELLVQECSDQVRQAARKSGCSSREILNSSTKGFNWQELLNCASDLSLFGDRKLIELRLPSGKPGTEGSKAIVEYLKRNSGDDILLIISGKIDRQSQNSKWFKAIDKTGGWIQLWPVDIQELPRWLYQRLSAAGLSADKEAIGLLAERVEGNLLAAVQEVEKLKLLVTDGHVSVTTVTEAVLDNARFNLFGMVDAALKGETVHSLRMLQGLQSEGTEASVVLWALAREVRTLYEIQSDCEQGQPLPQVLQARRVWKNRQPLVQKALHRHTLLSLATLLKLAAETDGSIKGFAQGHAWDHLEQLTLKLASQAINPATA